MAVITNPAACKDLMAASRPDPGPLTQTSTFRNPISIDSLAAAWAALWAANGVLFLEPLNPILPGEPQAITLPPSSVRVMMVLLKVALMWAMPWGSTLRPFFFDFLLLASAN